MRFSLTLFARIARTYYVHTVCELVHRENVKVYLNKLCRISFRGIHIWFSYIILEIIVSMSILPRAKVAIKGC